MIWFSIFFRDFLFLFWINLSLNAPILYNTIWRLLLDFIIGLGSYNEKVKVKYLKGKYLFAPISKFLTPLSSFFRYLCLPPPSWHPSPCLPFCGPKPLLNLPFPNSSFSPNKRERVERHKKKMIEKENEKKI